MQGLKKELDVFRDKFGSLTWERFKADDLRAGRHINGLTGCRTVRVFEALFGILNIGGAFEQLRIRDMGLDYESNSVRQAARALTPKDFMLLTLMRLRMGLTEEDLAWLFGVSTPVVSRAFESCLLHMFHGFHLLFPPPTLAMREKTITVKHNEYMCNPNSAEYTKPNAAPPLPTPLHDLLQIAKWWWGGGGLR
jgi:hypothetical protein